MRSNRLSYKPIHFIYALFTDLSKINSIQRIFVFVLKLFKYICFIHIYVKHLIDLKDLKQELLSLYVLLRKEVIQPHLPIRLPCYDFTPVIRPAFGGSFLAVRSPTSGISDSHGVTGGVYKTRERIHRSILICDY